MARSNPVALALGANQGDAAKTVTHALDALRTSPGVERLRASTVHITLPVGGPPGQLPFANAAAVFETTLEPVELLRLLLDIEQHFGRTRGLKDGPRTLDLDVLFYADRIIDEPGLIVPHPRLHERRFVLEPLAELASDWQHPRLNQTVAELLALLPRADAAPRLLSGQRVLVTGSTSGIGRAVALAFADAGADVIVHGRRSHEAAAAVSADAAARGVRSHYLLADVGDRDAATQLVDDAWHCWGDLTGAVLNAGADTLTGDAAKWPFAQKLDALLRVDVCGTMLMARALGERMTSGWLQTVGWDQAETGMEGDSGQLFGAAKGAIMAFTRSLAATLAPRVRVNCLAPGWIRTAWGDGAPTAWQERVMRETPLGRWGTPDDVAAAAVWLASPGAAFITGQTLRVNGGAVRA